MKMMTKILSLVLAVCLLCSVSAVSLADDCFTYIVSLLMSEDAEYAEFSLGEAPFVTDASESEYVMVCYSMDSQRFIVVGKDPEQKPCIAWWENVEDAKGFGIIYSFSSVYGELNNLANEGVSLVLGITYDQEGTGIWIESAETAAEFCAKLEGYAAEATPTDMAE